MQGDRGLVLLVRRDLCGDVVPGQDVAVQDENRAVAVAGQGRRRVADRTGGAERLVLGHIDDLHAEPGAVAERLGEHLGAIGGREHDPRHTRVARPRDLMFQQWDTRRRKQRFGSRDGQRAQPGALAPDQQDGFHSGPFLSPAGRARL